MLNYWTPLLCAQCLGSDMYLGGDAALKPTPLGSVNKNAENWRRRFGFERISLHSCNSIGA